MSHVRACILTDVRKNGAKDSINGQARDQVLIQRLKRLDAVCVEDEEARDSQSRVEQSDSGFRVQGLG